MNELIKKLSEQAYDDIIERTGDIVVFQEDFQQRFAELIVRECADIATINAHQWASPGTYVLKHFGVE
jgi:hypothetical protein